MWAVGYPGPVEDPLGEPVVGRGVAPGVLPRRLLRHVDDAVDAGLLRGLGEVRRRLQDAGADRIDEVGPLDAVERGANLPEVEEVAVDDLDPAILELLRAVVLTVGQCPDLMAPCQQLIDRRPPGVPRRAGDQNLAGDHLNSPLRLRKIVVDIQMVGGWVLDVNRNPKLFGGGRPREEVER